MFWLGSMQPGRSMEFNSETAGQAFPIGNSMDSHLAYADRVDGLPIVASNWQTWT